MSVDKTNGITLNEVLIPIEDQYLPNVQRLDYLTTAPTATNTDGLKVVVLTSDPVTFYNGYIYYITEA